MKINIDMEAWELATVIKGLTINAQPEEKKPSGTGLIKNMRPEAKSILSDETREELKKAFANAFFANAVKAPVPLGSEENPNPNYRPPMGGSHQ